MNSLNKNPMPTQDPKVRINNFDEVALGYSHDIAIDEANRCLNCKNHPCISMCPVHINIPGFIDCIKKDDTDGAYDIIAESSLFPAICGRVCPQESQCEKVCVRGIKGESVAIGRLERYVADNSQQKKISAAPLNGKKIAIVGSGPSGLSCASYLAKRGYSVTIYEALHEAGGVLTYGIPEFRLPKDIVKKEIEKLKELNVDIQTNVVIGKTISVNELFNEFKYDAVFLGTGAGLPKFMNIPGENLNGVFSANEFLSRINLMKAYNSSSSTPIYHGKHIVVVGGGNVAMDAARSAMRLDSESVTIVYRRGLEELPARKEEVEHAMEEGIIFKLLCNPIEIVGDDKGNVSKIKCIEMELGDPDASGRRSPVPKENSEFIIDCDCVIMALGTSPNPLIKNNTANLNVSNRGGIVVDETGLTSIKGLYAGGDAVSGAATVIKAMEAGIIAGKGIDEKLKN